MRGAKVKGAKRTALAKSLFYYPTHEIGCRNMLVFVLCEIFRPKGSQQGKHTTRKDIPCKAPERPKIHCII